MIRFMNRRIFRVAFTLIYDFRLARENFTFYNLEKFFSVGRLCFFFLLLEMELKAGRFALLMMILDIGYWIFGIAWIVNYEL